MPALFSLFNKPRLDLRFAAPCRKRSDSKGNPEWSFEMKIIRSFLKTRQDLIFYASFTVFVAIMPLMVIVHRILNSEPWTVGVILLVVPWPVIGVVLFLFFVRRR
jgi:hypothetical protein